MLRVYKASAGSGKTYTLTKQYLMLLLGSKNPESGEWTLRDHPQYAHRDILAITFTNKATEEMTRRIIKELAVMGGREPGDSSKSPYLADFIRIFHTDEPTLRRLASETLDQLLDDFMFFNVSTIDAFFQTVLRTFAREVEMPDNFNLELDSLYTINIGVNQLFASINMREPADPAKRAERKWLRAWLTRYMERLFESGRASNLFSRRSSLYSTLVSVFNRLLNEDFKSNSDAITTYLEDINRLTAFEKALAESERLSAERLQQAAIAVTQYGDFPNLNRHVADRINDWARGAFKEPTKTVIEAAESREKRYRAPYLRAGIVPEDFDGMVEMVCRMGIRHAADIERNAIIRESIGTFGLLGCLLHYVNDYCKENNLIMLSDTNSLLRQIINEDDTPFVYERIGYYLRHFLIDEVQDTSRMQWENLRPLLLESLSHSHDNLVIGDEKQCIYRFRNSDPDLLGHEIGHDIASVYGEDALSVEGTRISENNNWRSSREVVEFNNSLFHAMGLLSGDYATYSNVIQQINPNRKPVGGHVVMEFEALPEEDEETRGATTNEDIGDELTVSFALDRLMVAIKGWLAAGYRRNEIAVLVRTHSEGEAVIRRIMSEQDSPDWNYGPVEVSSIDSMNISSSSAVKMVIEILRLTQMPQVITTLRQEQGQWKTCREINPDLKRTRLLYCFEHFLNTKVDDGAGQVRNLTPSEAMHKAVTLLRDNPLLKEAEQLALDGSPQPIDRLLDVINMKEPDAAKEETPADDSLNILTLSTVVDNIIATYVLPDTLPGETPYLTAFQDLVYDFCQRGNSDIRSFLEWWDMTGCRAGLSSAEETDAISVMTIHQSKGLEFPCVAVPFASWKMVSTSTSYQPSWQWFSLENMEFEGIPRELVPPMLPLEFKTKIKSIDALTDRYDAIVRQQQTDALNVAYVAFTRAVNELYVAVPARKRDEYLLSRQLRESVEWLTRDNIEADPTLDDESRKWVLPLAENITDGRVEIGLPTSPERRRVVSELADMPMPAYNPEVNTRLSNLTEAEIEGFDFNDPRCFGDFLHRVLSNVITTDDLDKALRRAVYRSRLTPEQGELCREILEEAIADPNVCRWFDNASRVLTEQTLTGDTIDRRPDRIVWNPDGSIDVVDYKFGENRPEYRTQLRNYVKLMQRAGYSDVKAYIWFPITRKIIPV